MMDDALSAIEAAALQAWDKTKTLYEQIVDVVSQHVAESSLVTRHGCTCRVTSVRRVVTYTYLVRYRLDLPLRFFDGSMTGSSVRPHVPEIADIYAEHGGTMEGVEIVVKRGNDGRLVVLETQELTRESKDE